MHCTRAEPLHGYLTPAHARAQEWLSSAAFATKSPPSNGCFLLSDGQQEPMMRHLDGKTYLDPDQRAKAGLRAYPTDWTAALHAGDDTATDV